MQPYKLSKACNMLHQWKHKMNWLFRRSASSPSPTNWTKHSQKCLAINIPPTPPKTTGLSFSSSASVLPSQCFSCLSFTTTTKAAVIVTRLTSCVLKLFVYQLLLLTANFTFWIKDTCKILQFCVFFLIFEICYFFNSVQNIFGPQPVSTKSTGNMRC